MKTKKNLNWNDIVFEFKNKEYGAFLLRKVYNRDITIAASISLLVLLLLVGPPFIMAKFNKVTKTEITNDGPVEFTGFIPDEVTPPPPPPPPPPSPEATINKLAKFVVVDTTKLEIDILTVEQMLDSTTNKKVEDDVIVYVEPKDDILPPDIPTFATEMPAFPGGEESLMKFIKENFQYPEISKINNMQGKIYVTFVVDENGKITQLGIKRGIDELLDEEALRVVSLMPDWSPARQNGMPVKLRMFLPISCVLSD